MPGNVKKEKGKWILSMPNISGLPAISAEVIDFKLDVAKKTKLRLVNPKLHIPVAWGSSESTPHDVPLAVDATFSKDEGLAADISLTTPQAVGSLFTINRVVGHYQKGSFSAEGQVNVTLPGVKPFVTNLEYLGEENGFAVTTSKVQFNLPDMWGAKTTGFLKGLEYTSRLGAFQGQGFFEANIPVLGKTQAVVAMNRNRLNRADVTFRDAEFPTNSPIIKGAGDGKIDFDEFNRFKMAKLLGKFQISLHEDNKEIPPATLEGGASFENNKFKMGLELKSDLVVNQYLTLNHFKIAKETGSELETSGSFSVNGIEDAPDIPIESKGKEFAPVAQYLPSIRSDQIDASLKYGYDLDRGFWLDGTLNYPLNKTKEGGILSGR